MTSQNKNEEPTTITTFSKLKEFYDKRENPSEEEIKKDAAKRGVTTIFGFIYHGNEIMNEIYNTPIRVKAFIQNPNASISTKPLPINIKIMDEETSFFGTSKGIYLGEFDNFAKYNFPNKLIKVKKYRNDDILVFHENSIPIVGGKKNKTKRQKRNQTKTKKRYL